MVMASRFLLVFFWWVIKNLRIKSILKNPPHSSSRNLNFKNRNTARDLPCCRGIFHTSKELIINIIII